MIFYTIYDGGGCILRTSTCPASMAHMQAQDGEYILETEQKYSSRLHRVENGVVVEKTALPYTQNKSSIVADGEDAVVLSGVPEGTRIIWPDNVEEVLNAPEDIEFSVDLEGSYIIHLIHDRHLEAEVVIEATAQA